MRWHSTSQVSHSLFLQIIYITLYIITFCVFSALSMDPIYIVESLICFLLVFMAILEEYPGAVIINTL